MLHLDYGDVIYHIPQKVNDFSHVTLPDGKTRIGPVFSLNVSVVAGSLGDYSFIFRAVLV